MEKENKLEILIADDDKFTREYVGYICRESQSKYDVKEYANDLQLEEAINFYKNVALVITDNGLRGGEGNEGLDLIKKYSLDNKTQFILMSGYHDKKDLAIKAGAFGFLPKPFSMDELENMTSEALEKYHEGKRRQKKNLKILLKKKFLRENLFWS